MMELSEIVRGMRGKETWRDRLAEAIASSGKSWREVSLAAGKAPGYVFGILDEGKDPTIDNLLRVIDAIGGVSAAYIILGIDLTPETERLVKLFNALSEDQRKAFQVLAEGYAHR